VHQVVAIAHDSVGGDGNVVRPLSLHAAQADFALATYAGSIGRWPRECSAAVCPNVRGPRSRNGRSVRVAKSQCCVTDVFLIGSRSFLSISLDAVRPYEQNKGRGTMTTQDTTRRVVEGYFAAWTATKLDEAYALLKDLLLWAAALSLGTAASFGTATWLLLVHSHLPF